MNIENHIHNAKKALDLANDEILEHDYNAAIVLLASAYSDVRNLMEEVLKFKHSAALADSPAEDISQGAPK